MKNGHEHYRQPSEKELRDNFRKCLFVFDANVLLHVYRWSSDSKNELLGVLRSMKDRIWIPHQVAHDFYSNRLSVIHDAVKVHRDVRDKIEKAIGEIRKGHANFSVADFYANKLSEIQKELDQKISTAKFAPDVDDSLLALETLFEGKTGPAYSADDLKAHYKSIDERYKSKTPPGFCDDGKDGVNKYGDAILWLQLMSHVSTLAEKPLVILITDDDSDDWWLRVGGKKIGPLPNLRKEMHAAGAWYYQYSSEQFLLHCKRLLNSEVSDATLVQAKETIKSNLRAHTKRLNIGRINLINRRLMVLRHQLARRKAAKASAVRLLPFDLDTIDPTVPPALINNTLARKKSIDKIYDHQIEKIQKEIDEQCERLAKVNMD